jgi:quinol monooxygenase YgiN
VSPPFVFVGTHRLKEGKLDAFKRECAALAELAEANEPRLIAFNFYANEDGTEVSVVQVHPDADSMATHMQVVREHITGAFEEEGALGETLGIQIYGTPTDAVLGMIQHLSQEGVTVSVMPDGLAGFTRSAAE